MRFIRRTAVSPSRIGVLAGAFDPPTTAHTGLMRAAAEHVDEVICVLPRTFPHNKGYRDTTIDERIAMLTALDVPGVPLSVAESDAGLFIEIARELHQLSPPDTELLFICGRDAAERILSWDYGDATAVEPMLAGFGLLVAARGGEFDPPGRHRDRIRKLPLHTPLEHVSSTEVRDRISRREPWEHLVPPEIEDLVRRFYGRGLKNIS